MTKIFAPLWRHKFIIIVILIIIVIAGLIARKTILKPPPAYKTAAAKVQNITKTLEVSGKINADTKAVLKFQTAGKLGWVGIKAGDHVNKWQAVASLDKSILKKTLKKYLDDYMHQRWDFDQIRENNLVTTDDYDRYSFTNTIERLIEQEQFLLNKTVTDVEIQDITNRWATLISPIDGIVTSIDTPVAGVNVTVTDAITIVDPASLYFEVEIDESDLGSVSVGQTALIAFEAFPESTITGTISSIDFSGSTSDSGGVVFKAKLNFPIMGNEYRLGMTGDATITLQEKHNVVSIPIEAITEENDKKQVKILVNQQPQTKEIATGLETDTDAEITSGLQEGEVVVIGIEEKKQSK